MCKVNNLSKVPQPLKLSYSGRVLPDDDAFHQKHAFWWRLPHRPNKVYFGMQGVAPATNTCSACLHVPKMFRMHEALSNTKTGDGGKK